MNNALYQQLAGIYGGKEELKTRQLQLSKHITIASLEGICDELKVSNSVIEPLVTLKQVDNVDSIVDKLSFNITVEKLNTFDKVVSKFVNGYTICFVEGDECCAAIDTRIALGRAITEPPTSLVLRGPREGFVEDLKSNLVLLRKRLKTTDFSVINVTVGKYTNTSVAVCYISGVAKQQLVDEIVQKISTIEIDGIMDSYYIAGYLDDSKFKILRRVGSTEKPDIATAKLLEGRIAIVVDGSPMVLTVPYLFIEDLQSPADYHDGNVVASVSRILRFMSVIISVLLPAVYVTLQKYNYQIIPLKFLITILNATQQIPFSPLTEMLLVIIIFDILREANLRMPTVVGMSLSLVGAIVLGDAAVKAGLLGAPAVMIGALSGIGLFTMPENTLALSLVRIVFTFIGGIMGLFGVVIGMMALVGYMCSLQQYGSPFLAPYAPIIGNDKQDALLRAHLRDMSKRPTSIEHDNDNRRGQ